MTAFVRRFMGVLVLDPATFEEIEADRRAGFESAAVVMLVCAAAGTAALNLGLTGLAGFTGGTIVALGAWLIWISVVTTIGTRVLAEGETRSNTAELLRTLGFASAPGVFLAFASLRTAAPLVFVVVAVWMIAAEVIAMRQALDYRSTTRAIAVSVLAWIVALGVALAISMLLSAPVA